MRAGSHIIALSKSCEVILAIASFELSEDELKALIPQEIKSSCATIKVYARESLFQKLSGFLPGSQGRLILEALWPFPGRVARSRAAIRYMAKDLQIEGVHGIYCIRLQNAYAMRLLRKHFANRRTCLDLDDYESHSVNRMARKYRRQFGLQVTFVRILEAWKWRAIECLYLPLFDHVLVCSNVDSTRLAVRFPNVDFKPVPNVVANPGNLDSHGRDGSTLIFVGALDYMPNKEGIIFFCSEIYPQIRSRNQRARLLIVGSNPDKEILRLAENKGVQVIPNAPALAPYYTQADIALAPIRAGGGTRIKILEAFSYGLPVVSTTIGAEGLDVAPGKQILLADTAAGFAEQCLHLMENAEARTTIGAAGRDLVRRNYGPQSLEPIFHSIFNS